MRLCHERHSETSVEKTVGLCGGNGNEDKQCDADARLRKLVQDNAIMAIQLKKLERELKKLQEDYEAKEVSYEDCHAELVERVCQIYTQPSMSKMSTIDNNTTLLEKELESVKQRESMLLVGMNEKLLLKDNELQILRIEVNRQKALNRQLEMQLIEYKV